MQQENGKSKKRSITTVVIFCVALILSVTAGIIIWSTYINRLRADMNTHLEAAVEQIEKGSYASAQEEAGEALELAKKLRDDEATGKSEILIELTKFVIRGNEFFDSGKYRTALEDYLFATDVAKNIINLNAELITKKIAATEMYIAFFSLIDSAEISAEDSDYSTAISIYEEAKQVAMALSFADGVDQADTGIKEMQHRIIAAKRAEAEDLFANGEQYYNDEQYPQALIYYNSALEIFLELDDQPNILLTIARIDSTKQIIADGRLYEPPATDDEQDDTQDETYDDSGEQSGDLSNYEHNLSIDFDMKTLIDNQNQRPANQIRMGLTEGMNEGWYNGCGWVATYNALIQLGDPKHPAEIVRYFEESGGTVLGGVFGTYPNTIVDYLKSLGYSVDHTLFPQLSINLDDEIKASRVCILAYAHTSAAHYVAVEYREDIDKFVVYNDGFARARSAALGSSTGPDAGAAIDSVAALINNTREILFAFSLIAVR